MMGFSGCSERRKSPLSRPESHQNAALITNGRFGEAAVQRLTKRATAGLGRKQPLYGWHRFRSRNTCETAHDTLGLFVLAILFLRLVPAFLLASFE